MEAAGAEGRRLLGRAEASPERGRPTYASAARPAPARPMRKVQIIYYLCRNGQLEHPHFMEIAQHPHQPLRLKGTHCFVSILFAWGGQPLLARRHADAVFFFFLFLWL